jgi:4-diphosphocytidyl-2C-methyl-D-erythritol kinase
MNKRLENIKNLIGTDVNVCMVEDGAPCMMCGECIPEDEEDLEAEARSNYQREALDWGR